MSDDEKGGGECAKGAAEQQQGAGPFHPARGRTRGRGRRRGVARRLEGGPRVDVPSTQRPVHPMQSRVVRELCNTTAGSVCTAVLDSVRVLGHGASSNVVLVRHVGTGEHFAKKTVRCLTEGRAKEIEQELSALHECDNPYLIKMHAAFLERDDISISMLLEYMDLGSLDDFIRVEALPEEYLVYVAHSIVRGLAYLHDARRTIHRDVKPSNVLVNSKGEIKITDFGVSSVQGCPSSTTPSSRGTSSDATRSLKAQTFVGTVRYMAPERLSGLKYDFSVDIWSLERNSTRSVGQTSMIYTACSRPGCMPISPHSARAHWRGGQQIPTVPEGLGFSSAFCAFVARCVQVDPTHRPTAQDLLLDPWIHSKQQMLMSAPYRNSVRIYADHVQREYDEQPCQDPQLEVPLQSLLRDVAMSGNAPARSTGGSGDGDTQTDA